jgi:hypothetical protein
MIDRARGRWRGRGHGYPCRRELHGWLTGCAPLPPAATAPGGLPQTHSEGESLTGHAGETQCSRRCEGGHLRNMGGRRGSCRGNTPPRVGHVEGALWKVFCLRACSSMGRHCRVLRASVRVLGVSHHEMRVEVVWPFEQESACVYSMWLQPI